MGWKLYTPGSGGGGTPTDPTTTMPDRGIFDTTSGSVNDVDYGKYYVTEWTVGAQDMPAGTSEVGVMTKSINFDGSNGTRIIFDTASGKQWRKVKLAGGWEDWHSGVITVAGSMVNNADPSNPEIIDKAYFAAMTETTITLGIDPNAPSFLTGLALSPNTVGFAVDILDGAVKNETGRDITTMIGTISFQPSKAGGGTTQVNLWSERSADGVVWVQNSESLRSIEIANNGETFKTSVSAVSDWLSGEFLRFRAYAAVGGAIDFVSPTATVLGGEVITGSSVLWELVEA
jgi:hypothetical protein